MRANTHFTVALHILTWMALASQQQEIMTSDQIAGSVNTNPVFIRRILGRLHKAHLVNVHHGTSAGWTLAQPPEKISLLEVYQAVEQEPLFELHHTPPNQGCVVGKGIQPALKRFYSDAEAAMQQQFAQVSVADVLDETLLPASQAASKGASTHRHRESEQPEPA
ncbi:Rrf2 family transcriptional regulator [Ktedonobacter racemifer]|uniref:Transcriptional regulator, BadM/Rrf2 family n=1 Tax=Ktedonobacter racemifer DSM 44963 TaxID=485913 RepID=D6TUX5_KTERA|nr:Rrf2 family transcriptional regulator [Ktedonobacter racemifer]EFH85301.1 transcriptional regulator, BadM/Rrf2 family [Ktedonobacter racemifer DSM 44963]